MIKITLGDITQLHCDCIVNAANSALLRGGGVCGAIFRAAGGDLTKECDALGGCPTGGAKITKGYNLYAKWIIHAVGPIYSGSAADEKLLASCYASSLNLAKEYGIKSIAFPAISTGIYGYPLEAATKTAVKACLAWMDENPDYEIEIIFCCFDLRTENVYKAVVAEVQGK